MTFTIVALVFTFGPAMREEVSFDFHMSNRNYQNSQSYINLAEAEKTAAVQKEAASYNVNSYFSVVIPKINAVSNVIANVDANNKEEYIDALSRGVAHARGTYFPGQGKTIFLFSHSTDSPLNTARFNAVFYLLRKLEKGDRILVFFTDKKYEYGVDDKMIAEPGDTSWLTKNFDGETLILMTCDPPGTTWRRLLIIAKPI